MLRILITSGGTKVPLDPVRDLTNMSKGNFGSRLATSALKAGAEVIYLAGEETATPLTLKVDLNQSDFEAEVSKLHNLYRFTQNFGRYYHEVRYRTFREYLDVLRESMLRYQPHITMLAAAVSDYEVQNYSDTKIRSKDNLTIQMQETPKIISMIKDWVPDTFLVGFKLLVDASDDELVAAARQSIEKNRCDVVIANEWKKLKSGNHEVLMVEPARAERYTENIADKVIERVMKRWEP